MKYYVLIPEINEVNEIGEFPSIVEAEYHVKDEEDHITHGYSYVVISQNNLYPLLLQLEQFLRQT